ncbi:MAG: penicillin-binding protein activator LpoB [Bacteroidales bacterium]|jgi:TolB-like protein|nr:penicillin-binding protein activator LpoB [Bacteroidales bacterium]
MKTSLLKLLLLAMCLSVAFSGTGIAQNKKSIAVLPFSYGGNEKNKEYKSILEDKINALLVQSGRFDVVDREATSFVKQEKELQKSEDFMDGANFAEVGKGMGANYLVYGKVSAIKADEIIDKKGRRSYKGNLYVALKMINVETGKIGESEFIEIVDNKGEQTESQAIRNTVNKIGGHIQKFLINNFPLSVSIIGCQDVECKLISVSAGNNIGLKQGSRMTVYELSGEKGNEKRIVVGEVLVKSVTDEQAVCQITANAKELLPKLQYIKERLVLVEKKMTNAGGRVYIF